MHEYSRTLMKFAIQFKGLKGSYLDEWVMRVSNQLQEQSSTGGGDKAIYRSLRGARRGRTESDTILLDLTF